MNELKAFNCVDSDVQEFCEQRLVYLKSEVDNVIAKLEQEKDDLRYSIALLRKEKSHHKYKRCLAMAEMCNAMYDKEDANVNGCGASWEYISEEMKYWERWCKRWLEIADKFK